MKNKTHIFLTELAEALNNDNFFLSDSYCQEQLFEMQDKIANLVCKHANNGSTAAQKFSQQFPRTFKTS